MDLFIDLRYQDTHIKEEFPNKDNVSIEDFIEKFKDLSWDNREKDDEIKELKEEIKELNDYYKDERKDGIAYDNYRDWKQNYEE